MFRRQAILVFLMVALPALVARGSQESSPAGNYLGQEPPGIVPEPFAVDILPNGAFAGTFSPDLTEFYFNAQGAGGRAAISGLRFVDGEWVGVDFVIPYAFEPHIAPSGDRMFFVLEDGVGGGQGYVSVREADAWGEPQLLPASVNAASHFPMYFTSTLDGTLFWTKLSSNVMLVSAPFDDGAYQPVRNLPFSLNYKAACSHPGVAPDGSYVLFDVEENGQSDIYVSFATDAGGWSPARKVLEISNPEEVEMAPSVSPDGRFIFFVRMTGNFGIQWVDALVLEPYRPSSL